MFKLNELSSVQIEITNRCQASCPMCARNVRGGLPNENLFTAEWTLEGYKKVFTAEVLHSLRQIIFAGCYGDPMLNNDLIEMIIYTRSLSKNVQIDIQTNASARSESWWIKLAETLEGNHTVIFALDGLHDTHSLHRIGTSFDKIIDNAKSFIKAGGTAEWQFIMFKHNEHQIDMAKEMANTLGFKKFKLIDTNRFIFGDKFDVYDRNNSITHTLERASKSKIREFNIDLIKNYKVVLNSLTIDCEAKRRKEAYIDAFYHVYPCCYIAGSIYTSNSFNEPLPTSDEGAKIAFRTGHYELKKQIETAIKFMGGRESINAYKRGLKDILEDALYEQAWTAQWQGDNKNYQCAGTCGKNIEWSNCNDQFTNV